MSELSDRARALGEKLLRLRAKGAAGPGMVEVGEALLLCASELDRLDQATARLATIEAHYSTVQRAKDDAEAEVARLTQEQDVRAFDEVQNIGWELLATMKERDRARARLQLRAVHDADCMTYVANDEGEQIYSCTCGLDAALADEPREKP